MPSSCELLVPGCDTACESALSHSSIGACAGLISRLQPEITRLHRYRMIFRLRQPVCTSTSCLWNARPHPWWPPFYIMLSISPPPPPPTPRMSNSQGLEALICPAHGMLYEGQLEDGAKDCLVCASAGIHNDVLLCLSDSERC